MGREGPRVPWGPAGPVERLGWLKGAFHRAM